MPRLTSYCSEADVTPAVGRTLPRGTRPAFTLVELLVVVGIVTLLIALLLPALSKARAQAYQVACLSNLRQVGVAFFLYTGANRGRFPAPAMMGSPHPEDWVHWEADRDPAGGTIAQYLGNDLRVLVCPMGLPDRGPNVALGLPGHPVYPPYPYSYSVNRKFTGYCYSAPFDPRLSGEEFCRIGQVVNPFRKALVIEEDTTGINDGAWRPDSADNISGKYSFGSVRHDGDGPEFIEEYRGVRDPFHDKVRRRRCNVLFADGHVGTLLRWQMQFPAYFDPFSRGREEWPGG